jgi:hypothetical protein
MLLGVLNIDVQLHLCQFVKPTALIWKIPTVFSCHNILLLKATQYVTMGSKELKDTVNNNEDAL